MPFLANNNCRDIYSLTVIKPEVVASVVSFKKSPQIFTFYDNSTLIIIVLIIIFFISICRGFCMSKLSKTSEWFGERHIYDTGQGFFQRHWKIY